MNASRLIAKLGEKKAEEILEYWFAWISLEYEKRVRRT